MNLRGPFCVPRLPRLLEHFVDVTLTVVRMTVVDTSTVGHC